MVSISTDLSHLFASTTSSTPTTNNNNKKILILQGTHDSMVQRMQSQQAAFDALFPQRHTTTEWISGGTHQGFASYESAWSGTPNVPDAISYSEQQAQACSKTIDFLSSMRQPE
jgi:hypothetical protein